MMLLPANSAVGGIGQAEELGGRGLGSLLIVGEGEAEQDVAAVDVPVLAGSVLEWFPAEEFVEWQLGAAVVVEAGGGPKPRGVSEELADGRVAAGGLAIHRGQEVADRCVEIEQPGIQDLSDEGPGGEDLR
jgi:hypothetical protein